MRTWTQRCAECGQKFESRRFDAKFCSSNHRKAYSRRAENIRRQARTILAALDVMQHLATDEHLMSVRDEQLQDIYNAVIVDLGVVIRDTGEGHR